MKKLLIIVLAVMLTQAVYVNAQPQWKFYLAFEDGIGAKDTMWFIWDTTATLYGIDTLIGEGNVQFNYNTFNVFTLLGEYPNIDSTKVFAIPYIHYFDLPLNAFNYVLPLKIKWDTTLFHADYLPPEPVGWVNYARLYSDYFFWVNNNPNDQDFDMTLIDTVMSPDPSIIDPWFWNPAWHFPIMIYVHQEPSINIKTIEGKGAMEIRAFPNPFSSTTKICFEIENTSSVTIHIYDYTGKRIKSMEQGTIEKGTHCVEFSSDGLNSGIYFYSLEVNGAKTDTKKMILMK